MTFLFEIQEKQLLSGFTIEKYQIGFGYKKCCIDKTKYTPAKIKTRKMNIKKITIKEYSCLCGVCGNVILGINFYKSNIKLNFDNWKNVVMYGNFNV